MTARGALLIAALVTGCTTAAPDPAPHAGSAAALEAAPDAAEHRPATSADASDWALAIIGTPFVFAFRSVVCAATAVVAGPTAGLLALSEERAEGLDYLRWGLAENCDGPYAVQVPVTRAYVATPDIGYRPYSDLRGYPEPDLRRPPEPGLEQPRPLTPYVPSP